MTKTYITADINTPPAVPLEVARCQYCGGQISIDEILEMSLDENGDWIVESVRIECIGEPDQRDGESNGDYECRLCEWEEWHMTMPYVNVLPVEEAVKKWLNENYRFVDGEEERAKLERWKKSCEVQS